MNSGFEPGVHCLVALIFPDPWIISTAGYEEHRLVYNSRFVALSTDDV